MHIFIKIRIYLIELLTGYWSNGQIYKIFEPRVKSAQNKKVALILPRDRYTETSQIFPIDNSKELKNILSVGDYDFDVYSISAQKDASSLKVNFWKIDSLDQVPCSFVFPETLVLSQVAEHGVVYEIPSNKGNYFFINTTNGFYSAFKTNLMNSAVMFASASGVTFQRTIILSEAQRQTLMSEGLISTQLLQNIIELKVKQETSVNPSFSYKIFIPALVLTVFYYLLTSIYVFAKHASLDSQLNSIKTESITLLNHQSTLENDIQVIETIQQLTSDTARTSKIWTILYPLYKSDVRFTAIRIDGEKVYLTGYAPSALTALEELNKSGSVKNAQFKGSQRSSRLGERFTLEFLYE